MNRKGAVNTRWDEGDVRVLKSKWESLTLNGQHAFVSARALFFSEMREEGRESAEERPPWQVNEGPGREADERGCVSTSAGTTEGPVSCAQHGSAGVRRLSPGGLASSPGHSGDLISSPGQAHRVSLGSGRLPAVPSHAHYRLIAFDLWVMAPVTQIQTGDHWCHICTVLPTGTVLQSLTNLPVVCWGLIAMTVWTVTDSVSSDSTRMADHFPCNVCNLGFSLIRMWIRPKVLRIRSKVSDLINPRATKMEHPGQYLRWQMPAGSI